VSLASTKKTDLEDSPTRTILSVDVHPICYEEALSEIAEWVKRSESRMVVAACVNTVMEAHDRPEFRRMLKTADLVTPDGVPLVWALRAFGIARARRIYGPDLTIRVLEHAQAHHVRVGLYGASDQTLQLLLNVIRQRWPRVPIVFAHAPPFRPLTAEEDEEIVEAIRQSGAKLLLVGIGCPKQEEWMYVHRHQFNAVMLGVGAAFDFIAGTKPQAPRLLMNLGLEWLFRLVTEPRRLWRRYLRQNPRFVYLLLKQLVASLPLAASNSTRP
jgi:N-acetylglucosaminyldiphosphoundecaprenol N-acetyl-beta-D-mannosaminyltransferase